MAPVIPFVDTPKEAFELTLVAVAVTAISALVGLASWTLYRIERAETTGPNAARSPIER